MLPLADAAKQLGIPRPTLQGWLRRAGERPTVVQGLPVSVAHIPDVDDIEDLIDARKRAFKRRAAHEAATKLIEVNIDIGGPVGILHFGDPHVDDDGTDIQALEDHTELCRTTEGLFAANVGDTTNNWVGRLARLYSEQATTAKQAWMLAEWFIKRCRWLYMVGGNHDDWSGAGDPLKWIARQSAAVHQSSEARMALKFPNGRKVIVNARHDFAGGSQWNPVHAPMKAVQMGLRDHISICGHKHKSGYGVLKDPESGRTCHAIQVASYKVYDRYAKEKGFRDQALGPSVTTVIDPKLADNDPGLVQVFWNPHEAAEFLKWKRKRK